MPVGLFGKYPGKRDFVSIGMPHSVLSPLEHWLQAGLATSKERFGSRWKEMFLIQPIWNFRLGRAIGGVDCLGAFMPSVDGVGRYFPLCILAYPPDASLGYPQWRDLEIDAWLKTIHAALLSALADEYPAEPRDILAGLEDPQTAAASETETGAPVVHLLLADRSPEDVHDAVRRHHLAFAANHQSMWWTGGGTHVAPQMLMADGMPDPHLFGTMMGPIASA